MIFVILYGNAKVVIIDKKGGRYEKKFDFPFHMLRSVAVLLRNIILLCLFRF